MTRALPFPLCALLFAFALGTGLHAQDAAALFASRIAPLLKENCVKCHGPEKQRGQVKLDGTRSETQLLADVDLWFRVLEQVESGAMPPEESRALSADDRKAIVTWIRGEFTELALANQRNSGRSRLRRLSRTEYANTIEDIFGVRPLVDLELPADGRVEGYEKVSAALPLTSDGSMGYFKLAEDLLNHWTFRPLPKPKTPNADPLAERTIRAVARESEQSKGHLLVLEDGTVVSFNSDNNSGPVKYPGCRVPGVHKIRVSVYGYQTDKPLPFGIYVGSTGSYPQQIELAKVLEAPPGKPAVLETELYLKRGSGIRLIPFGLGVPVPKNAQASLCKAPGLAVQWLEDVEPEQPLRGDRWLLEDMPKALADEIRNSQYGKVFLKKSKVGRDEILSAMAATFKRVGARLFRRDLNETEFTQIMTDTTAQLDAGTPFETIIKNQLIDMMTSPEFFCIIEPPGKLSNFALASRLSFFLWNGAPDETLLELARKGQLHDPKILKEQTERLLKDNRSDRFVNDFLDQWLGLHAINDTTPDSKLYPEYGRDELLKYSSVWETQAFFRRMLDENLSVRHLVDSPWALVNEPLARHYGIPGVTGTQLQKVSLPDGSPFGGIWTQSALMKVTANGTNTSPVKRGVWVARRLLGIHISPPPPNIAAVEPDIRGAKTLREQLALHSNSANCAACHAKFDPYGFALESFDVTGAFRKNYRVLDADFSKLQPHERKGRHAWREGLPVDCGGKLPDGRTFSGITELRRLLSEKPEQLARGVTRHLLTFATGTPAGPLDDKGVDEIVQKAAAEGYGLRALIHAIVQSELFRHK
ncbi:MAG TPA: DUF1592 domain-containing protein [Planctomycetota bacterium]|nr:DUF1592 domain-containing protein [Planctomycetota bacterium]